jgi:predicted transport protein
MSDIKIYRISNENAVELEGRSATLERKIQRLIERNLEILLGVRFLETEYSTGGKHRGRIDTLGIDENGCPIIIEYKRTRNENVITQGLFYLDWLLDHKAQFELLVINKLGQDEAEKIEWSSPRLICIAGDFTRYDTHAVEQIARNIELIRYAHYGEDLLMLHLINATSTSEASPTSIGQNTGSQKTARTTVSEALSKADKGLAELYEAFDDFARSLGDDVQIKTLTNYIAYKRLKNFACVQVYSQQKKLIIHLKGDPESISFVEGFVRDTSNFASWVNSPIEVTLRNVDDLERSKPLISKSYEAN